MAMPTPIRRKSRKRAESDLWWFRRRVPDDCQSILGIREWWASLETTEYRVAERAILPHIVRTDDLIRDIRTGTYRQYQDDQLERIAIAWAGDLDRTIEADQSLSPTTKSLPDDRSGPISSEPDLDQSIRGFLDRLDWSDLGPQIEPEWPDYQRLRDLCFHEHYRSQVVSRPPVLERIQGQPVRVKPGDGLGFLETFEAYLREQQPRAKTAGEFRKSVTDFLSLHGGDIGIRDIARSHIVDFKTLLMGKPKRVADKRRKLGFRELIEAAKDQDVDKISNATVNKQLVPIHAVLEYAVQHGAIDANPAVGVKAARSKQTKQKRLPYSGDDLKRIFSSPVWSDPKSRRDERFWLPLLGLFTGARLEELAQLYVSDVHEQYAIHYLNIAEIEELQSVKNLASIRRVPVHPKLIEVGFLEYVKKRRRAKAKLLFDLTAYRGSYSHAFSKWYGRYVRSKVGITDSRKVFHSFRHGFKDAGRECGCEIALIDALQGHRNGTVSGQYGSGYSLKALDKAMKKIRYPGLDLGRIKIDGRSEVDLGD